MNLENTKIYTTDHEVIRKYAALCGKNAEYDHDMCEGIGYDSTDRTINSFPECSRVNSGVAFDGTIIKTITTDQVNALYDEKFGNHSEATNSSEWNGEGLPPVGIECELKYKHSSQAHWRKCKVFAYSNLIAAIWHFDNEWKHATIDTVKYEFRKPETPGQREERERLEAAYDLYCAYLNDESITPCPFNEFIDRPSMWLRIVDKTGYRKQKDGE